MRVRHECLVSAVLTIPWMACLPSPSAPSSPPPCMRVVTTATSIVEVTDSSNGAPVATFFFTQRWSHWEGDLHCLTLHEYDRENWVTATIQNRTNATISFDYTISASSIPYPGTVTRLAPGGSVEIGVCSLVCGSFASGSVSVTTGPITYER